MEQIEQHHHPGAIILMHCSQELGSSVEVLPEIIQYLRKKGYDFLTVNELLNRE